MPPTADAVARDLAARRFRYPFRRHQQLALTALSGQRMYLVMPPGAGKTAVGLELARRIGRRVLVLTPNTAVQGQWVGSWNHDYVSDSPDSALPCGDDRTLSGAVNVLTYQSVAVMERTDDDSEDPARTVKKRRALRTGDTEQLLALLHPNGRKLIADAAALSPWTVVLDECHHLLETWGALTRALVDELGRDTAVIGLTATPPHTFTARQRSVHDELFGDDDFEVPTPALVKDRDLAPYQELVYLTRPTPDEESWLSTEKSRFANLQVELVDQRLGSVPLLDWLIRRAVERKSAAGAVLSWPDFEAAEPDLARACLRFTAAGMLPLPPGAQLREEHRAAPGAADWVAVLTDFCLGHLIGSDDPADAAALASIKRVLPSLGFRLTKAGIRSSVSPVDRVCGLSDSKPAAAVHVLEREDAVLQHRLRALILCDFEAETARLPASLRDAPLTAQSGSALGTLTTVAGADVRGVGALKPMLITGRTLACPGADAVAFAAFCAKRGFVVTTAPWDGCPGIVQVTGSPGWTPMVWSRLATDYFTAGHARVLIGTRGLLGEGWDCPAVNVSIDLTTAATATAVTQMRGRSTRLDRDWPAKVADNWTITCVSHDHPRGDADYLRLVRKHDAYLAVNDAGEIESGVSHCDSSLSPYQPPAEADLSAITAAALARVDDRSRARDLWRIGEPYEDQTASTIRVRARESLGLTAAAVPEAALPPGLTGADSRPPARRGWLAGAITAATGAGVAVGAAAGAAAGTGAAVLLAGVGAGSLLAHAAREVPNRPDANPGTLGALARAVADGLATAGGSTVGADGVTVSATHDGFVRCGLAGATQAESDLFAVALEELLAPLADPRYLIGRVVINPPIGQRARMAFAARLVMGRPIDAAVSWHAVPAWLSTSNRRLDAFTASWSAHVGPPRCVAADSTEGLGILGLFRGADPYSITTQTRTVWR
jgi:superfamily II DNA or RNA helicase